MAGSSSQGTYFTFLGSPYTVTRVTVSSNSGGSNSGGGGGGGAGDNQRQRVSAAYLGSDPDQPEPFFYIWKPDQVGAGSLSGVVLPVLNPVADGDTLTIETSGTNATATQNQVEIDFIGATRPLVGAVGAISISGAVNLTFTAATCMSSSLTAAVGEIVRGSASFSVT